MTSDLLALVRRGWFLFPLHGVDAAGVCLCPKGKDCGKSAGKHPLTPSGFKEASNDPKQLELWSKEHPGCNWGVATGQKSGIFILDVDPRNGGVVPEGLPTTLTARTGGGGVHLYFAYPTGPKLAWRKEFAHGVDCKSDGGYVVVPPSKTVRDYAWDLGGITQEIVPVPDWVVETCRRDRVEVAHSPTRPTSLDEVVLRLRRIVRPAEKEKLISTFLDGKSIADTGERDNVLFRLCCIVGQVAVDYAPEDLAPLFQPLAEVWSKEGGTTVDRELVKVVEKLKRAQEYAAAKVSASSNVDVRTVRSLPDPTLPPGSELGSGVYGEEEIRRYAASQGCTVEEFGRRWIVQVKGAYYLYANGDYRYPALDVDLESRIRQFLCAAPIALTQLDPKTGSVKPKERKQLLREYSTSLSQVVCDVTRDHSFADVVGDTFYEATSPRRRLVPEFNQEINTWLQLLGGEHHGKLLDWLATSIDLSRPTALLYLSGASRAGKSLLADGLARVWTTLGVTKLANVQKWNERMASCPVILADEYLPKGLDSAWLREQITVSERPMERKFMPTSTLRGCMRFICASNPDDMLSQGDESFTHDSLKAIEERVLHLRVSDDATRYLSSIGGRAVTEDWVHGDGLARHVLWLAETRAVVPGDRLLVAGVPGSVHRALATQSKWGSYIMQTLVLYAAGKPSTPKIRIGEGRYLIQYVGLRDAWTALLPDVRMPSAHLIGKTLRGFAEQKTVRDASNQKWWIVDLDTLFSWEEQNCVWDIDELRKVVDRPRLQAVRP